MSLVTNGSAMHKISSKLTLTGTFNLGCDIDLDHSNPIFSLNTSLFMMIFHQSEFGCIKRLISLKLIKDIAETIIFWLYSINPHCDLDLEDRFPVFSHDILAHGGAPQYQVWLQTVAYKHSADWEQVFVTSVTSLTPEDTLLSLL